MLTPHPRVRDLLRMPTPAEVAAFHVQRAVRDSYMKPKRRTPVIAWLLCAGLVVAGAAALWL